LTNRCQRIPPQLATPYREIASYHDLPPTATYTTLVLWNFAFQSPFCDLTDPANLRSLHTVTGTRDEEWFYLISVALDSRGGPIIRELLRCMAAAHADQEIAMIQSLQQTTLNIRRIGQLLERMYERCDPQTYYHDVRPFLAGTKGMAASGLPDGVYFDYGNNQGEWLQYSGGSNGQSSLIQLLDIALGVDHYATGADRGRSSDQGARNKANGYMQEMRKYMPGRHREFLAYVEKTTGIREYATSPRASDAVLGAYKETVTALSQFRDIHIQIVTRYIITPSRNPPAAHVRRKTGVNLATASSSVANATKEEQAALKGTGGTDLMPFLKQTRDETREAASF
jgi:indoleamine 2,3-dioxygenase